MGTIFCTRLALALTLLAAVVAVSSAVSCPVSTCAFDDPNLPTIWMNTSTMASSISGLSFTLYPMRRNGAAFLGAFAGIQITGLQELQRLNVGDQCDDSTPLPDQSSVRSVVLRDMSWGDVCCQVHTGWAMLEPTVNHTFATVQVTDPAYPDFTYNITFSLVNESVSYHVPGTPNTDGNAYDIEYSAKSTKLTMNVQNWNWVGRNLSTNTTNPSYLKFFMMGSGQLESPGTVITWDKGMSAFYNASTDRSYLEMNYLKVYTADGVDYAFSNTVPGLPRPAYNVTYFNAPMTVVACQNLMPLPIHAAYWQNFTYDPTLTALYDDPNFGDHATPEQVSKRRLSPLAYAIPIAVVAVVLASVFVVLFVTPVREFFFKPQSARSVSGRDIDEHQTKEPARFRTATASTPAPTIAPAEPTAATSSSWTRSTKIVH